ncbi:sigma factor-like helix-turn-helix DNA-binding protein [Anaerofustis butyriciformans]|uniref:sigma factor-like helix-turn-helix DNA-binding protein n=1 Tax=Anaerofustis TaxID=264995 RepID=UPI003F8A430C
MKSENYKKTEHLLKEYIIYNKILELREEKEVEDKVEKINKAMDCLTNLERKIITEFFINNKNMLQISREIQLTREYTSRIKTAAIRKMEQVLFGSGAA